MSGRLGPDLWREGSLDEGYIPGEEGPERELAARAVRECLLSDFALCMSSGHDLAERMAPLIQRAGEEGFHPQRFLDGIIAETGEEFEQATGKDLSTLTVKMHLFTTALITALYDAGHNDLIMDIRPIEDDMSICEVGYLEGKPELPLRLTLVGSAWRNIGDFFHHVHLTCVGDACYVGNDARNCEFTVSGKASVNCLGAGRSRDTIYRIARPDLSEDLFHEYLAEGSPEEKVLAYLSNARFFERGNTLYVPDGSGGWKEVRP